MRTSLKHLVLWVLSPLWVRALSPLGVAALGYALAALFGLLPPPGRAICVVKEIVEDNSFRPAPPENGYLRVLVARLDGDEDGQATRRVVRALEGIRLLQPDELCRIVRVPTEGPREQRTQAAYAMAGAWARARAAQVVVYGERDIAEGVVRLAFATPSDTQGYMLSTYDLGERALVLPENFKGDLGAVVVATVLLEAAPASNFERRSQFLAEALIPTAERLEAVVADQTLGLKSGMLGQLRFAQGNVALTIGEEKSDDVWIEKSIAAYGAALAENSRARVPLDWAVTQNNLGLALYRLGEFHGDEKLLREAIAAYRAALLENTRERQPIRWATTQNNIGLVLCTLGELRSDEKLLGEAIAAYRAVLQEFSRERFPLGWATTQNNLGSALEALGTRSDDEKLLEESIEAHRAALLELTREREPLIWATTQSNLGVALRKLGEQRGDEKLLEESVEAYRAALLEFTHERVPLFWAATQSNLGLALYTLGERHGDEKLLEEAAKAFQGALDVARHFNAASYAETTERNLEETRKALEKLEDANAKRSTD